MLLTAGSTIRVSPTSKVRPASGASAPRLDALRGSYSTACVSKFQHSTETETEQGSH